MQKRKKTDNLHLSGNRLRHLVAKGLSCDTPTRTLGQACKGLIPALLRVRPNLAGGASTLTLLQHAVLGIQGDAQSRCEKEPYQPSFVKIRA